VTLSYLEGLEAAAIGEVAGISPALATANAAPVTSTVAWGCARLRTAASIQIKRPVFLDLRP